MSNYNQFIFSSSLLLISGSLKADPFQNASCIYGIDKGLLISVAQRESSLRTGVKNRNNNGSEDVCMMQINADYWLPKLPHITRKQLEEDLYLCVEVGAWVLAQNFQSHGRNWTSVGAYNTGFRASLRQTRESYINDVKMIYRNLHDGVYDKKLAQLGVSRHYKDCEGVY